MSEPRHISTVLGELHAATFSPRTLSFDTPNFFAWLRCNVAAAREGRPSPTGDQLLGFGTKREVEGIVAAMSGLPEGGPFTVRYSPPPADGVAVVPLAEIVAEARANAGTLPADPRFVVALGDRATCEAEATQLRRIRAGHRSQEGRAT